jgi:hypothetical protein
MLVTMDGVHDPPTMGTFSPKKCWTCQFWHWVSLSPTVASPVTHDLVRLLSMLSSWHCRKSIFGSMLVAPGTIVMVILTLCVSVSVIFHLVLAFVGLPVDDYEAPTGAIAA